MKALEEMQDSYIKKVSRFRQEVFAAASVRQRGCLWLKASLKDVRRLVVIASAPR